MAINELLDKDLFTNLCYGAIAVAVSLGLLALMSPRLFERLCKAGRHWVNTPVRLKRIDDYVVDTDALALKHVRLTGLTLISMAVVMAFSCGIL